MTLKTLFILKYFKHNFKNQGQFIIFQALWSVLQNPSGVSLVCSIKNKLGKRI